MARYITEIVEGMDLFVPDAYDAFSIVTGGMPNGDDSLAVANAPFLAWATPVATTPNVFTDFSSVFGLTFWFKHIGGSVSARKLMGSFPYPVPGGAYGYWEVRANGTSGFTVERGLNGVGGITSGSWGLIIANFGSGPRRGVYINAAESGSPGGPTNGSSASANPYVFSLGNYAAPVGYGGAFEIGKIAFHDHHISYTEQMLLYNAMML